MREEARIHCRLREITCGRVHIFSWKKSGCEEYARSHEIVGSHSSGVVKAMSLALIVRPDLCR
jgi:hypothetical protein